jgi:hypothetical protein
MHMRYDLPIFRVDDEATLWVRRGGRGSGKEVDALGLLW